MYILGLGSLLLPVLLFLLFSSLAWFYPILGLICKTCTQLRAPQHLKGLFLLAKMSAPLFFPPHS